VVSSNFKAYFEEKRIKVPDMQIQNNNNNNNNNSVVGILQKNSRVASCCCVEKCKLSYWEKGALNRSITDVGSNESNDTRDTNDDTWLIMRSFLYSKVSAFSHLLCIYYVYIVSCICLSFNCSIPLFSLSPVTYSLL